MWDTIWVWTSIYSSPTHYVVTNDPGNNTYPPGPVVRYGGTRVWVPPVEPEDYGSEYEEGYCNVMAGDAVLRGISEFWLVRPLRVGRTISMGSKRTSSLAS